MASSSEILFSEGEKILCYHGPLLYEAKCLKHRISEEKIPEYLIHYQGWSKNWDEWVKEPRILKYTEANLATQKELQEQQNSARKKGKRKSISTKDLKSSQEIKSEGSTHDPDSRSSTPSVDGKSRGKTSKVSLKSKETTPPSSSAPALSTTSPIEIVSAEQIKLEDAEMKDVNVDDTGGDTEPVFEEVCVPTKKVKKEAIVLVSDILFNKEAVLSKPDYATVSPNPVREVTPPKKIIIRVSDIQFNKETILSNPNNATIKVPTNLVNWLADDWYHVNKLKRLVNLPAPISVVDILKDYKEYKIAIDPSMPALEIHRVATEIEEYFNVCLGAFLLFKCERPQYADMRETHPDKPIPQIYGAHHFLRLFVKARQLFECLPESAVASAVANFHDVIAFLSAKETKYFNTQNYGIAPPEYHRRNM